MKKNSYKGECLCGACRYTIIGEDPVAMYLCHCNRCRKETGTIHSANVFFDNAQVLWERGEDNITHFQLKDTRKHTVFCKSCGSPLPWQDGKGAVVLPAGSLDEGTHLEPTAHIFYASRASWEDKKTNIKRFNKLPI